MRQLKNLELLITAAPDLYDACIEACTVIGAVIDEKYAKGIGHDNETKALDILVLAIIKASGAKWHE